MPSPKEVLKSSANLVHALHTSSDSIPQDILVLADIVERELANYQWAVDYAQEERLHRYPRKGKK